MQALVTSQHLRGIAGPQYARGEAYWREGRVRACEVVDGAVEGIVVGSLSYRVRVWAAGDDLASRCTCPFGPETCKHAVALALHYLGDRGGLPAPEPVAGAFATGAELQAFAAEHHVEHMLPLSADMLRAELTWPVQDYWASQVLARLSIGELGALDLAARHARGRQLDIALAKAAYRVMQHAAATVRDGVAEEQPRTAPSDEAIAPLWTKLVELRQVVRSRAYPRGKIARASGVWRFDPHDVALRWSERARIVRHREYTTIPLASRLAFRNGSEAELECTCEAPDGRCTHTLALLDATLDVLADPARAADARMLAEQLLRPSWARALDELAAIDTRATRAVPPIEVWWEIDEDGGLELVPVVRKLTKRGTRSAGTRPRIQPFFDEYRDQLGEADRFVAEYLATFAGGGRATYPVPAFAALVGHPRVLYAGHDEPIELVRIALGFTALSAADQIRLEPSLEGARMNPRLLDALLTAYAPGEPLFLTDLERNRCLLIDVSDDARRMWKVLAKHGDTFPPESHAPLLERLSRMEARVPLSLPRELKGVELAAETVTVLRLRLLPDRTLELELFVRPGPGAPLFPPGTGPRDVLIARDVTRGYVRRELSDELARARAYLEQLPMAGAEEGPPQCFRMPDPEAALDLVAALQDPPDGLEAEWLDEQRPIVRMSPRLEDLRVRIEHKRDWFGIVGDAKYEDGRIELALLLDAARRQQRFVRVDENRWLALSDALRARLQEVADQTFAARGKDARLELSPGAAPAIDALAAAGARVDSAAAWSGLAVRLAASKTLRPKPPATLVATLRDYQVDGHAWLSRVAAWGAGAVLADDMGLGKTVQAIAVLLDRAKRGPALVLAPTSVTYNWVAELARFAPSLRPILYTEQDDRAVALAKLKKRDVVIASYGLLVRDADKLAKTTFSTLVLDEAQALKNSATQRAKAARTLAADFRIALSGTPFENHLGELWSLYSIIFPGLLGSWDQFRDRFAIPIEKHRDPDARAALARVLRPFLLRRTKAEVARELPPRTEVIVPVALSDEERALYDDARLAAIAELTTKGKQVRPEQRRFQVLAALTRLRLLASHPRLYDPASRLQSSKLARALELLGELRDEGHRALVFSQFTSHLALVREALDASGFRTLYLDGATPAGERARLVQAFQDGEGDAFLISLKAGGQGINLTAADYILHLDPWWNPAVEDQATDRAHRIGQTRPVTVYRLIARETIEDRIVALHDDKRALVAGILEGTDVAARLTTRDLLALLQGGTA